MALLDISGRIEEVSSALSVCRETVGELIGLSPEELQAISEGGGESSLGVVLKFDRLGSVIDTLLGMIVKEDIIQWLRQPHHALNGRGPYELLENENCLGEIKDLLDSIRWGNYS